MRVKVRLLFLGLLAGILIPLNASAATLDVSGGQLMGASGVNVGGTLYDVAFKAGSCFTLFGGCTPSAFAFPSIGDAADVASSALLAQVFLGPFDSDPRLTNGNNAITMDPVVAWTPFALADGGSTVVASAAINGPTESQDIGGGVATITYIHNNTSEMVGVPGTSSVYAVWSPAASVPEPSTLLLLGSGLAGLGFMRRKFKV